MNQTNNDTRPAPVLGMQRPIPSFYAEGASQIRLGMPISRVMLYSAADRPADPTLPDTHTLAVELIMPTPALAEMCINILHTIHLARPQLDEGLPRWLEAVEAVFNRMGAMTNIDPNGVQVFQNTKEGGAGS